MNSPFDLLRRAFESTMANWPLVLMRLAEVMVLVMLVAGAVVVSLVPLIFAGASLADQPYGDTPEDFVRWLTSSWPLFAVIFIGLTIVVLAAVAIHSFVQAAVAGVLLEADRAAGTEMLAPRPAFRVFTAQKFLEYGRRHWWVTFLIYNVVWGVAGLIMILPAIPALLAAWHWRNSEAIFVAGCIGAVATLSVAFVCSIVAWIVSNIAIIAAVNRDLDTSTAIAESWRVIRAAFLEILVVVVALQAISMAVAMLFVMMHMSISAISMIPFAGLITIPFQIGASVFQNAVSLFVGIWMTAAFASIIIREYARRESAIIR